MVKIISISDEVYEELSRMKNGKSFTELFKVLISDCTNEGDPKSILSFLNKNEPISQEAAQEILDASCKGRKNALPRKSASFE
jgi:predicted CopG family antitoxin